MLGKKKVDNRSLLPSDADFSRLKKINKKCRNEVIHPIGMNCNAVYPVTGTYARAMLLMNKPWSLQNQLLCERNFSNATSEFILSYTQKIVRYQFNIHSLQLMKCINVDKDSKNPQLIATKTTLTLNLLKMKI